MGSSQLVTSDDLMAAANAYTISELDCLDDVDVFEAKIYREMVNR